MKTYVAMQLKDESFRCAWLVMGKKVTKKPPTKSVNKRVSVITFSPKNWRLNEVKPPLYSASQALFKLQPLCHLVSEVMLPHQVYKGSLKAVELLTGISHIQCSEFVQWIQFGQRKKNPPISMSAAVLYNSPLIYLAFHIRYCHRKLASSWLQCLQKRDHPRH